MVRPALAALTAHFGALRRRLADRPDTEHEQALVRLVIAVALFFYLLPEAFDLAGGQFNPSHRFLAGMFIEVLFSAGILACILLWPGVSPVRRLVGALGDIGATTYFMALSGPHGLPLFMLYIWVTLANGFRFGARYLVFCLGASIVGFAIVYTANDYWRQNAGIWLGLLIGTVALAMYVRSLVTRMFDAVARAEAANEAKRRFISVVSHEMRTPLNAIIGMADLLRDTQMSREQADMLQTLRSSSRVMLGLVEDVLDFSKIEAGKVSLEKVDFDLHALVNSTCRILSAQAAPKGVDFVVSILPEVPPALRGDPHYLRQILINLAGNAIKFTEKGSVTVHVSAQSETASGIWLKFSIRDTGIGIPPEAQARIFESFTQADQSTTRRFGGTGLGTTIAKQLVELMGGRIGLESAVGLGSTFWCELPFEKQPEREDAGRGELGDARVLLVGFPALERTALEHALRTWGASPVAVATIEEGLGRLVAEISVAKPYHSAVLYTASGDYGQAQRFRQSAPEPAPPVILAVPREAAVQRFDVLSAGFAAILELPFEKRLLFNVLHSVSATEETREGVIRLKDYASRTGGAHTLNVLVADDNPMNREVLKRILERAGHAVRLANDGDEALDAVEQERFDAVILDRNMPGTGGIEALRAIRLMGMGARRLPVVMLSADATTEAKREASEAGADAFLSKPIEAIRLLDTIRSLATGQEPAPTARAPVASRSPGKSGSAVVLNRETLSHLEALGSSPHFIRKLAGVFLVDSGALLERIEKSLAARDIAEFRSVLHAVKGSSASMGTDRLTSVCARLGALSDAELRLQSAGALRSLSDEFAAARRELERYLQEREASTG